MSRVTVELPWGSTEVLEGTTVGEILSAGPEMEDDLVAACLNERLVGLDSKVETRCKIHPVAARSIEGEEVVRRTTAVLLHGICQKLYPDVRLQVGQSLCGGYYYAVIGEHPDLHVMAEQLSRALHHEAVSGRQIIRQTVSLEAALKLFEDEHPDKARLLRVWPGHHVPLVSCMDFTDIRHGPYAQNARCALGVRIEPYDPGLILIFDTSLMRAATGSGQEMSGSKGSVLFKAYAETRRWNEQIGVVTVADLNERCLGDGIRQVIQISEAQQEKKIALLADEIADKQDKVRVVCVAGPSSAGKTTFVKRLSIQLNVNGITPLVLSLDDYYVDRKKTPRDENGDLDFESLEAIDLSLFHEQLAVLVAGKELLTPVFDFKLGRRKPRESWRTRRISPNEVLLIEGIHGLNPMLTRSIPEEQKFRIFINALTQLCIDDHNRIRTSDVRLLRRIVRDRRYRGYSAAQTIQRWPSVRSAEERHIFPFQENCDAMFNSALAYETAVHKNFAQRYLLEIPMNHPAQCKGYQLRRFLDLFVPIWPDYVPATSLLREFIGGSGFSYR